MDKIQVELEAHWQCPKCDCLNSHIIENIGNIVQCDNCENQFITD